jgi:hypothetical protein
MDAFWSLNSNSLRNHILIFDLYLQLVILALLDDSKVGLNGVDLYKIDVTSMSLWSLSFRSAWTIMVRLSSSLLMSLPLSMVFMSSVCGPSLRISTMLLAEEVSLFFMELIFTFLSKGASVTRYFWLISLIGWVRSRVGTYGLLFRSCP